ncbi:furin-like [Orbicella faveolata]|uniref:furin-like n=1 Tax=Orbicella faveolata TaxID=48498 RepID=UPI0009E527F4|nr:furin-like [Orbicella faveolata]
MFLFEDKTKVITATANGECTDHFSASSAAAAMASGLLALAVEANKNLTWRDMQHIIIRSSRADKRIIKAKDWNSNGANLTASNYVGFGLMDAYGLVSLAMNWTTVAPQLTCTIPYLHIDRVIPSADALQVTTSLKDVANLCPEINFLEHVQVRLSLNYTIAEDLEVNLTSPQGTISRLIQRRSKGSFQRATSLTNWKVLTLHHWGENPSGIWMLSLKNSRLEHENTGMLFDWSLIMFGTATDPLKGNPHVPVITVTPGQESDTNSALAGLEITGVTIGAVVVSCILGISIYIC